ncbi:MAG: glycine--tRNA ligase subunit beta [Planctomycetota bacterium]|jgi:glycyl-tRNA synthetase beta chain
MPDLLLEIGTEEIPAGYIEPALEALRARTRDLLLDGGFLTESGAAEINVAGTPRRLVLCAFDLPTKSVVAAEKVKGPPADRAFDSDNKPTKAAKGFARKHGAKVKSLLVEDGYVWAAVRRGGERLAGFLKEKLPAVLAALPFPKSMRWIPGDRTTFARPVRSLLCLLGKDVVPLKFAGKKAGRDSFGHAFHAPESFSLRNARWGFYSAALKGRKVLVDIEDRRLRVRKCVEKGAEKSGGRLYNRNGIGDALVDEVTNLVEWPGAVLGSFDEDTCRELPDEVIVAAMTGHQRYFPVEDSSGRLLPRFVAIANRDPRGGGKASIIRTGNERVLRARLADALFFWRDDKKTRLEDRLPQLDGVLFHEQLGSMRAKSERVAALSRWLAAESGQEEAVLEAAERGALLSKCDLVTHMVFEFPELQGVMGKYYAREDGEPSSVRQAIEEHYLPRGADGRLPRSQVGRLVAMADKFDSIVGGFAAGLAPTSSKDPYALRRAALGAIAIVRKGNLFRRGPGLRDIIARAREEYRRQDMLVGGSDELVDRVLTFFRDRLENVLGEQASSVEILRAVLAAGFDNLADLEDRLAAVTRFAERDDFADLCTVVERARNIVRKEGDLIAARPEPRKALLAEEAEITLHEVYMAAGVRFKIHIREGNYEEASELYLASFAEPLHKFFEDVYVNVPDKQLRRNRLALLSCIYRLYADSVADLAECAGQAKA